MKKETLAKRFDRASQKMKSDHFHSVFKALLNYVPKFGPGLSALFDEYIPNSKQKRMEQFIKDLAAETERLKDEKLDLESIQTKSFAFVFENVIRSVSQNYQTEKLKAYRAILINSLKTKSPPDELKEYYLNIVDSLTPIHIKLLKKVFQSQTFSFKGPTFNSVAGSELIDEPRSNFPMKSYSDEIISSAWTDLRSKGLVKEIKRTSHDGTYTGVTIEGHLTEFGKDFFTFVILEKS